MKKMFSFLFATLMTLFASPAFAVEVTVIEPDEVYSSIDDLLSAGSFAIVNTTDGKALYGTNNQNLGYGTYEDAFKSTNSGYLWKLVEADEEGNYHLQLITPAGTDYNCWGMGGMLNSQGEPQGWACSFILGLNNQKGQDIPNGAVYTLTYTNDGWTIKNVGTGMYQPYSAGPANSTEPTYWQFCSLKENTFDDGTDPVTYEIPASLNSFIENGTIFTLKFGDQYLYGTEQQSIGAGDWATACAETNNANGYILEKNDEGLAFFRAVKADGSNITAWGTTPCYLNSQPSVSGVIFNMGKDQDFKNGSSWIITEVEGGYTIQNLGNKAYLSGNGLSETPAVWEFYVPGEEPLDLTISPAFIVEGEEEVVTLNDHSSVSVASASGLKVNFGDNAAVRYATYVINELVEEEFMGQTDIVEEEVASGTLSINTIGYAEFAEPLTFYYGHKYNILIKAWDVDENNLFDENFNMAAPIGTFTAEFNGSTDETPAGEDIVVTPVFINGEEEVTLNDHASVSVEAANAIKVAFENAQPTEVNYVINEMVQSESEEGTSWAAGEEIASGTLSVNGIAYAEFANPLTFTSGKKYQLTVSAIAQTQELGSYTYEFNGAYVAPEPVQAEIADGVYRIVNVEADLFLSNGANWGTRAVLADNGISYNVVRNLENGKYTLKSGIKGDAKALRPSDGFNDQSGEWEIYQYDQNGGVVLFNGEKYFSYDGTMIPQFVDEPTEASVWRFISEEDLKAMVATATRENPMDATVYVKGADFLNSDVANAAWAGNKVGGSVGSGNTLINNTNCEAWNKGAFTISQTITDLPNGFYDLTAFGFYREGNRDVASSVDAYENGTENASVLSANDKSVALKSVYSEAKTAAEGGWAVEAAASSEGNIYYIPNGQAEAAACFEAGAYLNEIKNIEVTDGTLTISVSREGEAIFDWTVFDNIRLTYYGTEPAEEQTIDAFLINGEEEIALNSHSSVSVEKTEGIGARFGIPTAVASATYAIMPLVQTETEEGTTWVPGANITTGDLSINTVAYAEVAYTFEQGTKYQIDINVTYKDGTDETASFTVDGATEVEPTTLDAEIALNGTELSVVFPVGTDLGDNYTEKPYIKAGEEVIEIVDYSIDNTTGGFFDPLNKIIINLNNELAAGDYTLVIPAGTFIVNGGDNNTELSIPFVVEEQTIETALLNGNEEISINTHSSVSVEQIDGIKVQFGIPAVVKAATYSIMPMSLVQNEEGSSWTPDTENATTGDFSISTIANAEVEYTFEKGTKYQIVVKVDFFDGTDATEIYEIDGAAEQPNETVLLNGEEEIAINTHSSISVEQIDAIKVIFGNSAAVASATYSIMPMILVEGEEGSSWTPDTENATTGDISVSTIGFAAVDYIFEQGTKYQIDIKINYLDGTDATETYTINGAYAEEEPTIYKGYIASTGMLLYTGVSNSFEQSETISVTSKEISFENVFIPVVNIATGDFTIPVTKETDANGNVIYRAQEVDVDLHDVYYSGGQDDAVPFKAWLIGTESTDGPILFVHLQSNLQDIFIAYNALLKDAKWMMSEISPEDVNAGGAKVLNFLEATSINSVATDAKANGKYLENGKVIIVNKDKKYNVNGAIVK